MSSCEDLFQSFSAKIDISNISSDLFTDSSAKSLVVKKKTNDKQYNVVQNVATFIPDFSSYEKHELVVESDVSQPVSTCLPRQLSNGVEKNVVSPANSSSNLAVETQSHHSISVTLSGAFCSTPGPSNYCPTSKFLGHTHNLAPKSVSGDVLLNALQVTPIHHPALTYQKLSVNFELENTLPQLDAKQTLSPLNHTQRRPLSPTHKDKLISNSLAQIPMVNHFPNSSHELPCCNSSMKSTDEQVRHSQPSSQSPLFICADKLEAGKKSGTFTKRLTRRFRYENMILNRSYMTLYAAGDIKGTLFKICEQTDYKTFAQLFTPARRKNLLKIGEGCFGEVFRCPAELNSTEYVVIKLIPIEGDIKFNGESQKSFSEVLSEVIVSKELTALGMGLKNCTYGFVELKKVHLIQGSFPAYLKKACDKYDREKKSENDNPSIFTKSQLWVALESAFCGVTLENNIPTCPCARLSILLQIGLSLAVAELELKFEHRDLHWGNVLISQSLPSSRISSSSSNSSTSSSSLCNYCSTLLEDDKDYKSYVKFRLNGQEWNVRKFGVTVYLIDFTMSRLEQDEGLVYVDLSSDPTLFQSQGDYQFDIYRHMKSQNRNNWQKFTPKTNIMWFHYLSTKLCSNTERLTLSTSFHTVCWKHLQSLEYATRSFNYSSAYHLVTSYHLFKNSTDFFKVSLC
ncbi:Serine/threonine-protein kinase haspin [Schistosoma japonicum]|nr:Serine/threonine-protein kinase haspin [Schistosoma japonicum]